MYEFAIAARLVDHVVHLNAKKADERVAKLGVMVGAQSSIDPKVLKIAFDELMRRVPQRAVQLSIERPGPGKPCRACQTAIQECDHADDFVLSFIERETLEYVGELVTA